MKFHLVYQRCIYVHKSLPKGIFQKVNNSFSNNQITSLINIGKTILQIYVCLRSKQLLWANPSQALEYLNVVGLQTSHEYSRSDDQFQESIIIKQCITHNLSQLSYIQASFSSFKYQFQLSIHQTMNTSLYKKLDWIVN